MISEVQTKAIAVMHAASDISFNPDGDIT